MVRFSQSRVFGIGQKTDKIGQNEKKKKHSSHPNHILYQERIKGTEKASSIHTLFLR